MVDMDFASMYPNMISINTVDTVGDFKLRVLKNRYSGAASGDQPLYIWREPQIKTILMRSYSQYEYVV